MKSKLTKLQTNQLNFLNDTVKFYSEDVSRRATDCNGDCLYKTEDNRRCAIGRHLRGKPLKEALEDGGSVSFIYNLLPKWMQNLGLDFLEDIQSLHDWGYNWCREKGKGLSQKGEEEVNRIKKEYKLN